jgi:uncharacterized RDD family membrane protein YckC
MALQIQFPTREIRMPVDMSITAVLYALAFCAIFILIALLVQWGIRAIGTPAEPAKLIMLIVWIIVGVACIARLLRLLGMM